MTNRIPALRGRARVSNADRHVACRPAAVSAAVAPVAEALEGRQLLTADAPSFIAIPESSQTTGNSRRAISYYDVSDLNTNPGSQTGVFNQLPLFTVWTGYEVTTATAHLNTRNFEEISSIAVNPANGDTYQLSFDSISGTSVGVVDDTGDTAGDYDLYRINFATVYNDFITNHRARGVMYTDPVSVDGFDYVSTYTSRGTNAKGLLNVKGPAITATAADDTNDPGIPPGRDNTDGSDANDIVFLPGTYTKVGEIARVQGAAAGADPGFFDQQDLQFVDSQTLLLMENYNSTASGGSNPTTNGTFDKQIRVIRRTANTTGNITNGAGGTADLLGSYAGPDLAPAGTERWESVALSGDNFVNMDDAASKDFSEVDGMRYVERDGVKGVWVSEADRSSSAFSVTGPSTTGDQFAFFKIDFNTLTATKTEISDGSGGAAYPSTFQLTEGATSTDPGEVSWFDVDQGGNLVIDEAGFTDTPNTEQQLIRRAISNYNAPESNTPPDAKPEITLGAFLGDTGDLTSLAAAPTDPGQTGTKQEAYGVYERGHQRIYIFDALNGKNPDNTTAFSPSDVYVIDANPASPTFGQVVYSELNGVAITTFSDANKIRAFTLGDYAGNADGVTTAADIDALYDRIADPTVGGKYTAALGKEMFDLTGDDNLTQADVDALVHNVLGTEYGDVTLNGSVGPEDFNLLATNFGLPGGWAKGDFTGNDSVGPEDFNFLATNFGFNNAPPAPVSPLSTPIKKPVTTIVTRILPRATTTTVAANAKAATISTAAKKSAIVRSLES